MRPIPQSVSYKIADMAFGFCNNCNTQFIFNIPSLGKCYQHYIYLDHDYGVFKKTSFNSFEICFSLQQLPWRMRVRTKQKMENETGITYHLVEAPAPLANNRSIKISTDYVVVVISIQRQLVN